MPNKTIRGLDGKRFIVRGAVAFTRLFFGSYHSGGNDARANYSYRTNWDSLAAYYPTTAVSAPTFYAPYRFKTAVWRDTEYKRYIAAGLNFIRINTEPAMMNATESYVDPKDGLTYPSDPEMLDTIIKECDVYGIVVQICAHQDRAIEDAVSLTFQTWLANRYKNSKNVWLGVYNEPYGTFSGGTYVGDANKWDTALSAAVVAIRTTGFTNPVCIDPTNYASTIDTIHTKLTTNTVFTTDPNLIINIHYYPQTFTVTNYRSSAEYTYANTHWLPYINEFCIMINETGHTSDGSTFYDPNLNNGVSANPTYWSNLQAIMKDALEYFDEKVGRSSFNGVVSNTWGEYIQALFTYGYSPNSMHKYDFYGEYVSDATWATIFKGYGSSRGATNITYPLT